MENNNANLNPDNSTTENQSSPVVETDETSLTLRRSPRVMRPRIPCGCCTTGMHVRTFTNIMGRRPLHTPRATAAQRSVKRKRVSRINPTTLDEAEAVERPSTRTPRDRNNVGIPKRLRSIRRRRPIFAAATGRRVNAATQTDALDLRENAATQATANTSDVEDKNIILVPFAEIKLEPASQAPSVFGDEESNTIVNSTLLSTCKEESFTLPRSKEYYRQNPPSFEQSSSDEEDEDDEEEY